MVAGLFGGAFGVLNAGKSVLNVWDMFASNAYKKEMEGRTRRERQRDKEENLAGAQRSLLEEYYSTTASSQGMEHTFVAGVNEQYSNALGQVNPLYGKAISMERGGDKDIKNKIRRNEGRS